MENLLLGKPSGVLINCTTSAKRMLYKKLYISFDHSKSDYLYYKDIDHNSVIKIIKNTMNFGTNILHEKYGLGTISGTLGNDGYIIKYDNIKLFVYFKDLIYSYKYKFV
jgi:hypothetical protein